MGQGRSSKDDGGRVFVLLCILVLIVGIVSAAGMIMAVLNYNNNNDTPININVESSGNGGYGDGYGDDNQGGTKDKYDSSSDYKTVKSRDVHYDNEIWTVFNGNFDTRLTYLDERSRQFRGYFVDVINEVCQIAGKNCALVQVDHRDCFNDGFPQRALQGRELDGCVGFSITHDRARSTLFTHPLTQAARPVLITRRGNPAGVNPNDLSGITLGLLEGWWANTFCILTVLDQQIPASQISEYPDSDYSLITGALMSGEIDAMFISNELPPASDSSIEVIREYEPCLLGGDSVMLRKDSLMKAWWDPAFETLINSRAYREICNDIDDPAVHGFKPGNTADNVCIGR